MNKKSGADQTKRGSKAQSIQLKIELDWIKPKIWRTFAVDSSSSLHDLHAIIQIVMGWEDYHLYSFNIGGVDYAPPHEGDDLFDSESENSKKAILGKLGLREKQKLHYIYDFGDDWNHTITVQKIMAVDQKPLPICLDGERNCPPEDCGSVPGYEDLVEAMRKPKSRKAKELMEWLGEPYDPERFDIAGINKRLKSMGMKKRK